MRIRFQSCTIDLDTAVVHRPDGDVGLSATEAALVGFLTTSEQPVSRRTLLREVWGYSPKVKSRTVDTTLARLRKKVERNPAEPEVLLTLRGVGVQLADFEEVPSPMPRSPGVVLFGREALLAELKSLLLPGALVTLVGIAGVGKTALARAAVGEGWLLLDACNCRTTDDLRAAIAEALGLSESPSEPPSVDGFLLDGADELELAALEWLTTAPQPVLVTRLGPSHHPWERVLVVPPLPSEVAAELFVHHLQRLGYPRRPTPASWGAQLDGLPLECELLAPLFGLLGEEAFRLRIEAEDPVRGSLSEAIGRAVDALDDDARQVLETLSCFRGGFDLDAAAAVAGVPPGTAARWLHVLTRRSLVTVDDGVFRLLRSVRDALDSAPHAAAHRRFLTTLAERLFRDGPESAVLYRADLLHRLPEATDSAERLAMVSVLFDLAQTVGPFDSVWGPLNDAVAKTPTGPERARMMGLCLIHQSLFETDPARLAHIEAGVDPHESLGAVGLWRIHGTEDHRVRAVAALTAEEDLGILARWGVCLLRAERDRDSAIALGQELQRRFAIAGYRYVENASRFATAAQMLYALRINEAYGLIAGRPPPLGYHVVSFFAHYLFGDLEGAEKALTHRTENWLQEPTLVRRSGWATAMLAAARNDDAAALEALPEPIVDRADSLFVAKVQAARYVIAGGGIPDVPFRAALLAWSTGEDAAPTGVGAAMIRALIRYRAGLDPR